MKKDEIIVVSVMGGIGLVCALITLAVESLVAKWIWGILAVAMFGVAIYTIIDVIVKSKRKPTDVADILSKSLGKQAKERGLKGEFAKILEERYKRRQILFEGQRPNDDDYGYSSSNPIMTSTIWDSDDYLGKLRTFDGESFTWERQGSYCMAEISGIENVMVDEYLLFLNGEKYKTIYICPYGHSSTYVPKDMQLVD